MEVVTIKLKDLVQATEAANSGEKLEPRQGI